MRGPVLPGGIRATGLLLICKAASGLVQDMHDRLGDHPRRRRGQGEGEQEGPARARPLRFPPTLTGKWPCGSLLFIYA